MLDKSRVLLLINCVKLAIGVGAVSCGCLIHILKLKQIHTEDVLESFSDDLIQIGAPIWSGVLIFISGLLGVCCSSPSRPPQSFYTKACSNVLVANRTRVIFSVAMITLLAASAPFYVVYAVTWDTCIQDEKCPKYGQDVIAKDIENGIGVSFTMCILIMLALILEISSLIILVVINCYKVYPKKLSNDRTLCSHGSHKCVILHTDFDL